MHLLLNQELLVKATDFVAKAADKHHRFVILGNIKLELTKQTLILTLQTLKLSWLPYWICPMERVLRLGRPPCLPPNLMKFAKVYPKQW